MSASLAPPVLPDLPHGERSVEFYQRVLTRLDGVIRLSGATQPEAVILSAQLLALCIHGGPAPARRKQASAAQDLIREALDAMLLRDRVGPA